jgi:hypothetical protein
MMRLLRSRLRRSHWRGLGVAAVGMLLFLVMSGCGTNAGNEHAGHAGRGSSLPDNIETTASAQALPSFLDNYTDTTRNFYAQVQAHEDILKELDCYCGCQAYNDPHDSLYRCFIVGIDDKGVHWTDHGSSCGVCLMELRDVIQLTDEGKTADEIRSHIDTTYGGTGTSA